MQEGHPVYSQPSATPFLEDDEDVVGCDKHGTGHHGRLLRSLVNFADLCVHTWSTPQDPKGEFISQEVSLENLSGVISPTKLCGR